MKKILLTAAALTLGTSAYAWTTAQEDMHTGAAKVASVDKTGIDWEADKGATAVKVASVDKAGIQWDGDKTATAATTGWTNKSMTTAAMGTYEAALASLASYMAATNHHAVPAAFAHWTDPTVETASVGKTPSNAEVQIAMADFKSKDDVGGVLMASADDAYTGMGGPLEEAASYPPCDPGPGDDRCIQLYERGVPEALAAWKGADSNVGMGGPYEPAADNAKPAASAEGVSAKTADTMPADSGDHGAHGSMPESTMDTTPAGKTGVTAATTPGAIGGPVEQRTGYPACSATVTDSCIQLYERGVTGQGN